MIGRQEDLERRLIDSETLGYRETVDRQTRGFRETFEG